VEGRERGRIGGIKISMTYKLFSARRGWNEREKWATLEKPGPLP